MDNNGDLCKYLPINNEEKDDVDLESLMLELHCENDSDSKSESHLISDEDFSTKLSTVDKRFLKSKPISIFSKSTFKIKKHHQKHTMASSAPQKVQMNHSNQIISSAYGVSCTSSSLADMTYSIYVSDLSTWFTAQLPSRSTCAKLIEELLVKIGRKVDLLSWSIVELNTTNMTERIIEDVEMIGDLIISKLPEVSSRFCLNKTLEKYNILRSPELCLPPGMLTIPNNFTPEESPTAQRVQLQHILTKTATETCGFLHLRNCHNKNWKKRFCILRNSGLYYSRKNKLKKPEFLVSVAEVHSSQVWCSTKSKHHIFLDSPTPFTFYLKPLSYDHGASDVWLCADNEQVRSAWIGCLRLKMNGCSFYNSFVEAQQIASNCMRSSADVDETFNCPLNSNKVNEGHIQAVSTEKEPWKKCQRFNRVSVNGSVSLPRNSRSRRLRENGWISRAIHETQSWYFGKLSRDEANEEVAKLGNVDGTFLVRNSQTITDGVVLTLVYNRKPRHVPLTLMERHGEYFYTIDQGHTRFDSLIHFIDFHRLNKGSLPCLLIYDCSRSRSLRC